MMVDLYTKAVLTVIAAALTALVVSDYIMPADAQDTSTVTPVFITNTKALKVTIKQPLKVTVTNVPGVIVKNTYLKVSTIGVRKKKQF